MVTNQQSANSSRLTAENNKNSGSQQSAVSSQPISMADLLAQQAKKPLNLNRGEEVEGSVIAITDSEVILDLGTKAEGVIYRKDLTDEQSQTLKVGSTLKAFVVVPENESGQALLTLQRAQGGRGSALGAKWAKFQESKDRNHTFIGKGIEVNKGGLIVEVSGVRGFLPSSQVNLSQAANIEELIGQDIEVTLIEVDPAQNRLIFTQKTKVSEDVKSKISQIKTGDTVKGSVAAVLPFGIFVSLPDGVEGLVHISEIAWEKAENPTQNFKVSDEVEAKVVSLDADTGRVNLSIKQLAADPFGAASENFQPDDVVKGEVTKVTTQGVNISLKDGVEGFVPAAKMDPSVSYEVGQTTNFLVDTVDSNKRRILLTPFLTSTEGLIYK